MKIMRVVGTRPEAIKLFLSKEHAFIIMLWNRVGFKIGDRCVILRGNVAQLACKGKFWEYDRVNKNPILSPYHMTDEILPDYIGKIRVGG